MCLNAVNNNFAASNAASECHENLRIASGDFDQKFISFVKNLTFSDFSTKLLSSIIESSFEAKKAIIDNLKPSDEEVKNNKDRLEKLEKLKRELKEEKKEELKEEAIDMFLKDWCSFYDDACQEKLIMA